MQAVLACIRLLNSVASCCASGLNPGHERPAASFFAVVRRCLHSRDDVQFIDLRDVRELEREGVIPGAFHAPRGMLEFWVDPESPYHKPVFSAPSTRYVLFCAAGWRSALVTQTMQQTGLDEVGHIDGGFTAWKAAGAPVADCAGAVKRGADPQDQPNWRWPATPRCSPSACLGFAAS